MIRRHSTRTGRAGFIAMTIAAGLMARGASGQGLGLAVIDWIVTIVAIAALLIATSWRLHDLGRTSLLVAATTLPLVEAAFVWHRMIANRAVVEGAVEIVYIAFLTWGIVGWCWLAFKRGDAGANAYGEPKTKVHRPEPPRRRRAF